jgi:hypothetical protein
LIKLEEKVDAMKELILEEGRPKPVALLKEGGSEAATSSHGSGSAKHKDLPPPDSPSNVKLIDDTIRSEAQRQLYKQFMSESKARNKGLKFELLRAQVPSATGESKKGEDEEEEEFNDLELGATADFDI